MLLYIPTVLSVSIYCGNEEWETANLYHTAKCITAVFLEVGRFADACKPSHAPDMFKIIPLELGDEKYG